MSGVAATAPVGASRWRTRITAALAVSLTAAAVLMFYGYVLRMPCNHNPWLGQQYRTGCYNDLQAMFGDHALAQHNPFPYIHAKLQNGNLQDGAYEYPVLTGVFIWGMGALSHDSAGFLAWSALFMGLAGIAATWLLWRMTGWRALLFAAAPTLALYAFYNWDLFPVLTVVAGVFAWRRRRYGWSAAWLALGMSFKLFPGLFLLPLVVERIMARDRRGTVRAVAGALVTAAAVNVPFIVASPSGWWVPFAYQGARTADINTLWFWGIPGLSSRQLNLYSTGLTAASAVVALAVAVVMTRRGREFPFLQVCGALLVAFMFWSKVDSLQYALWVLPFFALLRVRPGWWVSFIAADLAVYWGYMRSTYDANAYGPLGLSHQALVVGAWWRLAMLALLFVVFLRAPSAVTSPDREVPESGEAYIAEAPTPQPLPA